MHTLGREEELQGGDPNRADLLSTHPASEERARAAHEHAAELRQADRAPIASSKRDFLNRFADLVVGNYARDGVFDGDDFLHPDLDIFWTLPSGWEQVNQQTAVGAIDEEHKRLLSLTIAGEGSDALAVAEDMTRRARLDGALTALEINGLSAARARARDGGATAEYTFISNGELVFLITGISPTDTWASNQRRLRASADSFRKLRPSDRPRIREDRLKVVDARPGETIGSVLERNRSRWPVEEAAIANAILKDEGLEGGQPVKVTRPVQVSD